jgi:hypothetical protein
MVECVWMVRPDALTIATLRATGATWKAGVPSYSLDAAWTFLDHDQQRDWLVAALADPDERAMLERGVSARLARSCTARGLA